MKKHYQSAMKNFFRIQLLHTRDSLSLTQAQMARKLLLEDRSYAALESGESCCGTLTLALFLIYCCKDKLTFLGNLRIAFEQTHGCAAQHAFTPSSRLCLPFSYACYRDPLVKQ